MNSGTQGRFSCVDRFAQENRPCVFWDKNNSKIFLRF